MGNVSIPVETLSKVTDTLEAWQSEKDRFASREEVERIASEIVSDAIKDHSHDTGERRMCWPVPGGDDKPLVKGPQFDNADRSYRGMFCRRGQTLSSDGWRNFDEFYVAINKRLNDERTVKALQEGDLSGGGALVPEEFSAQIFDVSLEQEVVRPRATIYPMKSDTRKVPGTVLGDHSSNLYGGLVAYWRGEGTDLTEAEPTFRNIELTAKKLTVFGKSSTEVYEDATDLPATIQATFVSGLSWYMDKAFLRGSGSGEPLGILNSDCLITVDKEATQEADTVLFKNLANMLARLHPACWARSVWVIHPTVIPQLLKLGTGTGDTGSGIILPMDRQTVSVTPSGITLLTRPVIVSEKMNPVGDKGDILLADFSQYIIGARRELRLETSPHIYFESDQLAHRCIARIDGEPAWNEALTLEDGSTTVGPFVVIEARE